MKIHTGWLAPLVLATFLGVVLAANMWELPTQQHRFNEGSSVTGRVEMIVDGLRCRGTSNFFVNQLSEVPGIVSVDTYVQEHRAVIVFNPENISVDGIRQKIEAPVRLQNGQVVKPFTVLEVLK